MDCARAPMRSRGFTLIELITVLVLIGALAVFVAPRFNPTGLQGYGFRQEVLSAARHAQKTAMASGCPVRLSVDAASDRVELHYSAGGSDSACGDGSTFTVPLQHPARSGPFVLQAPSGSGIAAGGVLVFDGFGATGVGLAIAFDTGPSLSIEPITGYAYE